METTDQPQSKKLKLDKSMGSGAGCSTTDTEVKSQDAHGEFDVGVEEEEQNVKKCDSDELKEKLYSEFTNEQDVGITEYISKHQGFMGVLKQRYSDFLVNEIDLAGNTVRLTNTDLPQEEKPPEPAVPPDILTEEKLNQLKDLELSEEKHHTVHLEAPEDKEKRTLVHKLIKQHFPSLDSSTETKDGTRVIAVKKKGSKSNRPYEARWPQGRPDYCHFVLYKENKDTMDACNLLAKFLRIKPGSFTYAGTKDKRGKTSQMVSINRYEAEKLKGLNKVLRGIHLGNFSYKSSPLRLGDLKGNHFTVILRSLTGEETQIQEAMASLQETGFINYFGMQRFGTSKVPTHHIGRAILCCKWREAVELILKPRMDDSDEVEEARRIWTSTQDAEAALRKARRPSIERHLLVGLSKHDKNDLVNALACIPRNTRLMYVHSYQSFVWNSLVSRRLKEYGLQPQEGDLVLPADVENCDRSEAGEKVMVKPEIVTADTVKQYTIHDIVMPLPGYDVQYPEHKAKTWYKEMLAFDGLSSEQFKHKNREYALPGGYRKIVLKPSDMSWEVLHYDDTNKPLVLSDLDKMNGVALESNTETGQKRALKMEFSLPSSTYATMVIREVLHTDTSAAHQATLNDT